MLEFMALMILLDLIVKIPDYITVYRLRQNGWKGGIHEYYEWKRR